MVSDPARYPFSRCQEKTPATGLAPSPIHRIWMDSHRSMTTALRSSIKMKVHPVLYLRLDSQSHPGRKLHADCNVRSSISQADQELGEIDTKLIHPHGLLYLETSTSCQRSFQ